MSVYAGKQSKNKLIKLVPCSQNTLVFISFTRGNGIVSKKLIIVEIITAWIKRRNECSQETMILDRFKALDSRRHPDHIMYGKSNNENDERIAGLRAENANHTQQEKRSTPLKSREKSRPGYSKGR